MIIFWQKLFNHIPTVVASLLKAGYFPPHIGSATPALPQKAIRSRTLAGPAFALSVLLEVRRPLSIRGHHPVFGSGSILTCVDLFSIFIIKDLKKISIMKLTFITIIKDKKRKKMRVLKTFLYINKLFGFYFYFLFVILVWFGTKSYVKSECNLWCIIIWYDVHLQWTNNEKTFVKVVHATKLLKRYGLQRNETNFQTNKC